MFTNNNIRKKGFTLVEILVVVFIIGLLATMGIVSFSGIRKNARDIKRMSDIRQIQMALDSYFRNAGSYPSEINGSISYNNNVYLNSYPTAPNPPDGDCEEGENNYTYVPLGSNSNSYVIYFCLGSPTGDLEAGPQEANPSGVFKGFSCGEDLIDERDNQIYPTVKIGSQCWLKENLNYDNGCSSKTWSNNKDVGWCGCYGDNPVNCDNYGRLYQWSVVMDESGVTENQGLCPQNWRVPDESDWTKLFDYSEGLNVAGGKLKSIKTDPDSHPRWDLPNTGATDEFNFSALPGGLRQPQGSFRQLGLGSEFWSSSLIGSDVLSFHLDAQDDNISVSNDSKLSGLSLRCIKN
jgi:uncharacterized protein (TIGR02145 family)/prepilin-type N-terminal cleavage/methylation domain-containing protein